MGLKPRKPMTPGQRFVVLPDFAELTAKRPERALRVPRPSKAGRNNQGRITTRHRGGGHKRLYRVVDFRRNKHGIPARVAAIEYDPNRSARLALLHYQDGEKRYILAPLNLRVGATVVSGPNAEPLEGNALPLSQIPLGLSIHNVELRPGRGGQLARSAGMEIVIMAREGNYAHLRLPSGELRRVHVKCYATIGQLGNVDHEGAVLGKAGRKRWLGIRPTVRGVAMNPVDHVMGGGEGRTSGGGHPRSPWGKFAKGKKTRSPRRPADAFIIQRRKK